MNNIKQALNNPCPCGSDIKYKKCCQLFHKGRLPKNALELMKSRYVAYKLQNIQYIMDTTHKDNHDYQEDFKVWGKQILDFCKNCNFNSLEILEFLDGNLEAYVTFRVQLVCQNENNSFKEKSKFIKENDKWFYHSGDFNE